MVTTETDITDMTTETIQNNLNLPPEVQIDKVGFLSKEMILCIKLELCFNFPVIISSVKKIIQLCSFKP